jgi:acyl-coenzyme A synthetase/AMP-(fatty) acid ligase
VTGDVDGETVRAHAKERLPGSHVPKQVFVVDALPRTETGKVRRSDLTSLG